MSAEYTDAPKARHVGKINYNRPDETNRAGEWQDTPPLNDDLVLTDCGLDSLGLAVLIARLAYELGTDPFKTADPSFR